jgi:hypothetical protein
VLTGFRSAAFDTVNIFLLLDIKSYLDEEANCTEPSLSVSVPWWHYKWVGEFTLKWDYFKPGIIYLLKLQKF